jgi:hypothetical protein
VEKMKVDERQFRFFEVSFYIMTIALIVLLAIVLYFVGEKPKMCIERTETTQETTQYDLNNDGNVDISDLLIKIDEANEIRDYILNN